MFESMQGTLNGLFGKVGPGMCRLTVNGNIAVKCGSSYKTYNVEKETLTNVTNFCFNIGDEMFFVIPTTKAEVGYSLLVGGNPKCVTKVDKKKITVIDYESAEEKTIVPERHVFMGSTYLYGKIISMFGNSFKKGKGLGNIVKMMMMSQMMGGGNNGGTNNGGLNFGQMMAFSMFFGGDKMENPFEGMFDLSLDEGEKDEETTADDAED